MKKIMKKIWSFVITGGPCSGKTTGLSLLEQELSNRGYYVLVIPETATELITTGIRPYGNSLSNMDFQCLLAKKQLQKEKLYREASQLLPYDKIVILHDRGLLDNKAYVSDHQFQEILACLSINEVDARDQYDAVFHLVTAANGAESFYTLANNTARTETTEEAIDLDNRGIAAWTGHSHFRIIDNSTGFNEKMERLICEICSVLGEPIPLEIERKYLIQKPVLETLKKHVSISVVDIVQTYLKSPENSELRVRQRGQNGNFSYYFTEKRRINFAKRIELERKITQDEYIKYLTQIDTSRPPIVKQRVCFVHKDQYFEIDLFSFSEDKAILEIELTAENDHINLPDFIKVIKDVTDNLAYTNYNLAKSQML